MNNKIIVLIAIIIAIASIPVGINRMERAECLKWKHQATQYEGYFLTDWQKEQCDNHKIKVGK